MIKAVLLDIDGVLTDGRVTFDAEGREFKTINFKDVDAVFAMKRQGIKTGLITGEKTAVVQEFRRRFQPDFFYCGCKNKPFALREIMEKTAFSYDEICYAGDGRHDLEVMKLVKYSASPADAIREVREAAAIKLEHNGGDACIWELWEKIRELSC